MSTHKTASIVFLLLTLLISLVLSGLSNPTMPPVKSCSVPKTQAPDPIMVKNTPVAQQQIKAKDTAFTPFSSIPVDGSAYQSAYHQLTNESAAPSSREFEYVVTSMY
jgi:hypothetical protein